MAVPVDHIAAPKQLLYQSIISTEQKVGWCMEVALCLTAHHALIAGIM